jgi:hypothetical protein
MWGECGRMAAPCRPVFPARLVALVCGARRPGRAPPPSLSRAQRPLASVSAESTGDLRRLAPLLQRCDPLVFADGLSMDGVLEPLEERFKLVNPLLQDFNAPRMPRSRRLGGRARRPPAATQLDDTAEDCRATPPGPPWIAGTRRPRKPPTASFSWKPRERRRKQDPTSGAGRTGRLATKTTRQPTCPPRRWLRAPSLPSCPWAESKPRQRSANARSGGTDQQPQPGGGQR